MELKDLQSELEDFYQAFPSGVTELKEVPI